MKKVKAVLNRKSSKTRKFDDDYGSGVSNVAGTDVDYWNSTPTAQEGRLAAARRSDQVKGLASGQPSRQRAESAPGTVERLRAIGNISKSNSTLAISEQTSQSNLEKKSSIYSVKTCIGIDGGVPLGKPMNPRSSPTIKNNRTEQETLREERGPLAFQEQAMNEANNNAKAATSSPISESPIGDLIELEECLHADGQRRRIQAAGFNDIFSLAPSADLTVLSCCLAGLADARMTWGGVGWIFAQQQSVSQERQSLLRFLYDNATTLPVLCAILQKQILNTAQVGQGPASCAVQRYAIVRSRDHSPMSIADIAIGSFRDNYALVLLQWQSTRRLEVQCVVGPPTAKTAFYCLAQSTLRADLLEPIATVGQHRHGLFRDAPDYLAIAIEHKWQSVCGFGPTTCAGASRTKIPAENVQLGAESRRVLCTPGLSQLPYLSEYLGPVGLELGMAGIEAITHANQWEMVGAVP